MNKYVHMCLVSLCMYLLSVLSNGQNWILITGQRRGGGSWTYSSEVTCQNRLNSEQELCNYILVGNIKAKHGGRTDVNSIVRYWFKLITSVKTKNSSRNIQCSVYARSSFYVGLFVITIRKLCPPALLVSSIWSYLLWRGLIRQQLYRPAANAHTWREKWCSWVSFSLC